MAEHFGPAAGRPEQRGKNPEQSRLAAAVGAEKSEDLARGDLEADPGQGAARTVIMEQVVHLHDRSGHHRGADHTMGRA